MAEARPKQINKDDKARGILNKISAALDTTTLTQLNKRVQIDNEDAAVVAEDWLKSKGLI